MVEALLEECRTRSLSRQGQLEAAVPPSNTAAARKPQTPQKKKSAGGPPEKKERSREEGRKRQEKDLEREARRDRERRDRRDRERVRDWEREERRKRDRDLGWRGEDERERRDRERYEGSRTQREGSSGSKSSGISEGSRLSSRRDGPERSMAEKANKVRKIHGLLRVSALEDTGYKSPQQPLHKQVSSYIMPSDNFGMLCRKFFHS